MDNIFEETAHLGEKLEVILTKLGEKEDKPVLSKSKGKHFDIQNIPPEILKMIFEHLEDFPEALKACYGTCPLWENILKCDSLNFCFHLALPFFGKYLQDVDLLNLRLVSKSWKKGVDSYSQLIENQELFADRIGLSQFSCVARNPRHKKFSELYDFSKFKANHPFVKHVENYPANRNPFITKSVSFCDTNMAYGMREDSFAMWAHVISTFLPKFGGHIKYCRLMFTTHLYSGFLLRRILFACLKQLPNLVALNIWNASEHCLDDTVKDRSSSIMQNLDVAGVTGCPKLESLVYLEVKNLPPKISQELLSSCGGIKKLKFSDYPRPQGEFKINLNLGKLEKLSFASQFDRMTFSKCPVTVLCCDCSMSLSDVVKISSFCADTLSRLEFNMRGLGKFGIFGIPVCNLTPYKHGKKQKPLPNLRLELPHLTVLKVIMNASEYPSIDFILKLTSLKEFSLDVSIEGKAMSELLSSSKNQIVKFGQHLDNMEESNIWQILPSLEALKMKWHFSGDYTKKEIKRYTRPTLATGEIPKF